MLKGYNELNEEELKFVNDALLEYINTYKYEKENKQTGEVKVYNFDDYAINSEKLLPLFPELIEKERKIIDKSERKIEKLQKMDDNMILTIIGTFLASIGSCAILQENTTVLNLAAFTTIGGFASLKLSDIFIEKRANKHYVDREEASKKLELLQKAQTHFWEFEDYYKKLEKTIK